MMKKYKKIVFVFGGKLEKITIFEDPAKIESRNAYQKLSEIAEKEGLIIYYSKIGSYNKDKGFFNKAFYFSEGKLLEERQLRPDIVHSRANPFTLQKFGEIFEIEKRIPMINSTFFDYICDDKYINYLMFHEYYPESILIKKGFNCDFNSLKKELKTERIFLKPNVGSHGDSVQSINKNDINESILRKYSSDVIVQESIDCSDGIPGITDCVHDLRVTVVDSKISYVYVKIAQKGSFLCNVSQGGKMKIIAGENVPKEVILISNNIIKHFKNLPNTVYSIDFARDKSGEFKLIEMNGRPGILFNEDDVKIQEDFYRELALNFIDYENKCNFKQ